MENLENLFRKTYGKKPDSIIQLKGDGSDRRIFRITSGKHSVIGVRSDDHALNVAFLDFGRHFRMHGLKVPEIYAEDLEHGTYLEEDLGDYTLFDWMSIVRGEEGFSRRIVDMYASVIKTLPLFQIMAGRTINYDLCHQHIEFSDESMTWDLGYFTNRFLKVFYKGNLDEKALENDFGTLKSFLLQEPCLYFLYRDFQSRNVMIKDNEPHFIDYQSGRRGALQYDVASLLYDAKANIPEEVRDELLQIYLDHVQEFVSVDPDRFRKYFYGFVLIRTMQAFGAYGYLSVVKGKKHFFKSVPFAVQNLEILLDKDLPIMRKLPTLKKIYENLVKDEELRRNDYAVST